MMFDRWLVVTDLDGTLMNHHDYRVDAALPVLDQLEHGDVPVIFNTSKTYSEVETIARRFNNQHPFIVENGSAIIIPRDYFDLDLLRARFNQIHSNPSHHCLIVGSGVNTLQHFLRQYNPRAINLSQCSIEQAMAVTGLDNAQARDAQARQYSIPLKFYQPDDEQAFISDATNAGFTTVKGGRFVHLLGNCSKGESMVKLKQLYQQAFAQHFGIIALGDSPNDLDMLQAANKAIVVQSPSSNQLNPAHDQLLHTQQCAPEGWAEGIRSVLTLDHNNNLQHIQ